LVGDGTFRLADGAYAGAADLRIDGAVSLTGTGGVAFVSNNLNRILEEDASALLTLGPDQTIEAPAGGSGQVQVALVNQGTVDAVGGTIGLSLRDVTNEALMRARDGGTLAISGITVQNAGGVIRAEDTGTVKLTGATVEGGRIEGGPDTTIALDGTVIKDGADLVGGGTAMTVRGASRLEGVTASDFTATVFENGALTLRDTDPHGATIRLADGAYAGAADLRIEGPVSLTGTGGVAFVSKYLNRIFEGDASALLTLGPDQTIEAPASGVGSILVALASHGTVRADGRIGFSAGVEFRNEADGLLTGGGTVNLGGATFVNLGRVAPGASPGRLIFVGDYSQAEGAVLEIEIAGPDQGTAYDWLDVQGPAELDGLLGVMLDPGYHPTPGQVFTVLTATGGITDHGLALAPGDGGAWILGVGPNDVTLEYVPEPATLALVAAGLAALVVRRRPR